MMPIFLGQAAIPIGLIVLLVVRPPRHQAALVSQLAGTLLALGALARVGVWLFPPWWVPHVAAAAVMVGGVRAWQRSRKAEYRTAPLEWFRFLSFAVLGLASGGLWLTAARATHPPRGVVVVELAFPLEPGRYLVVNGGTATLVNAHRQSMDSTRTNLRPWRGNAYAVDLIATNGFGLRAHSVQPGDPREYEIFGRSVLAPCGGSVVVAVDGLPDKPVPIYDREHPAGNHVVLECGEVHVILAHLRPGSLEVRSGMRVAEGAIVGEVGNSGGTDEPHLHVQRPGPPGAPMAGDPLPMRLAGRFLVRGDRIDVRK